MTLVNIFESTEGLFASEARHEPGACPEELEGSWCPGDEPRHQHEAVRVESRQLQGHNPNIYNHATKKSDAYPRTLVPKPEYGIASKPKSPTELQAEQQSDFWMFSESSRAHFRGYEFVD